jgi:hypothetical protein
MYESTAVRGAARIVDLFWPLSLSIGFTEGLDSLILVICKVFNSLKSQFLCILLTQ